MIEINEITDVLEHIEGIDAVIFDLDDTLYSEKDYVKSGFEAVADTYPDHSGLFDELWTAFLAGRPAIDAVSNGDNILKESMLKIYREHMPSIHLYDGVEDMLSAIRASGRKLGLITDGRPNGQRNKIHALGIEHYFDRIIVTDELGLDCRKPNPIAYLEMHKSFNVPFSRMCYIGDNMKKDFISPDKLGMSSIWFKNLDGLYAQQTKERDI